MLKNGFILFFVVTGIFFTSCGKKTVPSKTATVIPAESNTSGSMVKKIKPAPLPPKTDKMAVAPAAEENPAPKPQPKPDFPKVITVNDNAASKSIDGRLFYDVLGHRYWKNYNDGKYYLFDKSMYSNPDFKPPK
ncbi:MAG TPA: hypothetical protein VLS85_00765 [Hanamia sp.]|nr:hypothetical protein [Hanamia sp.]